MAKLSPKKRQDLQQEFEFQYSRSSGPGGQKVNKTETRVELIWDMLASSVLTSTQKHKISSRLKNRFSKQGLLQVSSDQYRTRPQNQRAVVERCFELLEKALHEDKKRIKTKPSKAAINKRIKEKKQHGEKKRSRNQGKRSWTED